MIGARSFAMAVIIAGSLARPSSAQVAPRALTQVSVDERVGAQLPLDTAFQAVGRGSVKLGDVIDGTKPVVLVLAYARCTMLCSLVLRGVATAARGMSLVPGDDYRLVVIGLDPKETIDEAARKQAVLLEQLGRPGERSRWPYLVGTRANIDAVAAALGFHYAWDPRTEQYAHAAVIFVVTPAGQVSRYLHGVQYEPRELAAALHDARDGRLISTAATELLRCFRFDPALRRSGERAELVLRIGGAVIFGMLAGLITTLVIWERRARRRRPT
ncbi:MAG: SCO family protein [Kofleriaceae bacterium]